MPAVLAPKPYLYADELAALTPWSIGAIRKKVQRGELKRGVHYFQQEVATTRAQRRRKGRRPGSGRLIFKWAAIVEVIENGLHPGADRAATGAASNGAEVIAIEEATERLRRLLG